MASAADEAGSHLGVVLSTHWRYGLFDLPEVPRASGGRPPLRLLRAAQLAVEVERARGARRYHCRATVARPSEGSSLVQATVGLRALVCRGELMLLAVLLEQVPVALGWALLLVLELAVEAGGGFVALALGCARQYVELLLLVLNGDRVVGEVWPTALRLFRDRGARRQRSVKWPSLSRLSGELCRRRHGRLLEHF